jgi:predicted NAD/FAD-binding protein
MRIAVVGAGVSGLVCAHLLRGEHEVTLFEAGDYAGGHTHTVRVDTTDETHHVDTGFIVHNDRNYPCFVRLLDSVGVATQPAPMSFSVSDGRGGLEYNGASANGLFANRANLVSPRFHRMILDLLKFNREAPALIGLNGSGPSLGEFLDEGGYSRAFVERLIVPQASAVWSADPAAMWEFPASFLAEFFANHGMFGFTGRPQWRAITGGSARYVERLVDGYSLHLAAPVRRVERFDEFVEVTAEGAEPLRFDEVVLAVHSDQALAMLADPSRAESEVLGAIRYQPNDVLLHTDRSLLPRRPRAWASWNFHLQDEPVGRTTVTYHMNRLQTLAADREFCVTLNRNSEVDPAAVIRRLHYDHPVFTPAALAAQERWDAVSGPRRTHYCGAYWGYGFHEDGVVSALRVCERFGAVLA